MKVVERDVELFTQTTFFQELMVNELMGYYDMLSGEDDSTLSAAILTVVAAYTTQDRFKEILDKRLENL